jgi:hypothetical protein
VAGQCELFASALGGIGLQRVLNTALLAALLADEQRTWVVGYMLVDAESPEMRTSQPASRADPTWYLPFALATMCVISPPESVGRCSFRLLTLGSPLPRRR